MTDPSLKKRLAFVAKFVAALVLFYVVLSMESVSERVVVPFTEVVVKATALLLIAARQQIEVAGTVIRTPRFALDVHNGCNGVEAIMVLAAAMLAFPATLRSRITGLVAGSIAISILNLIRVGSLVWLGEYHRAFFDFVHVGVWQTLVILAAVSMFVFWSRKFAKPLPAHS
jgi:exosortase H (IPTLxxWG-CTERM-specific)